MSRYSPMDHYRTDLNVLLLVAAGGVGFAAYGLYAGRLPTKRGVVTREESPIGFKVLLAFYLLAALGAAVGAIDRMLRIHGHRGLW